MEILSARLLIHPRDRAASTAFYRDILGLAIYREFPGGTVFFAGGALVEISGENRQEDARGTSEKARLWLQVRDLGHAAQTLARRGVTVLREPRREPWGLEEMWIADPDGLRIVLVEIPADHPLRADQR
jgi:catechol 2,3-dioxygenase-like lactoylglutathione lyase family enzyme